MTTPPTPPPGPPEPGAAPDPEAARIKTLDERFGKIENEQERQGGILTQILDRLPGKAGAPAPPSGPPEPQGGGKSIADLVREGVEELEAKKASQAAAEAAEQERKDHADRIRKLEERAPTESTPTLPGKLRAAVQRYGFGIDQPSR